MVLSVLDYGLGDWFDIGPKRPGKAQLTSVALTATAMYYHELEIIRKIALYLGKPRDAHQFEAMAAKVKEAFNARFYKGGDSVYEKGSQTGLAMALFMNLVTDDAVREQALNALVADIKKRGYAFTAGDVGFRYLIQALQRHGRSDVVYEMNHNDTIPGYAYQLKKGATALTESWQAYDNVSNNHFMLGHLMEWLYSGLGGIAFAEEPDSRMSASRSESAWRHIVIAPQMVGGVTWARTSLETQYGTVSCYWTKEPDGTGWSMDVTVPEGCDATVHLPDGRVERIKAGRHKFQ
ncbi:MAG: hypothetical protein IJ467_07120 [Bacteroidaceae bacterium]|nr:hypothetical protein [Bacteroidaceae bacterium]